VSAFGIPELACDDALGRHIVLESDIWHLKILPKHRELDGRLDLVEDTLSKPDLITADANYRDRECFYRRIRLRGHQAEYLKVCVAFQTDNDGRVVTAYQVAQPPNPDEESILWMP
jgi:hypothetical protein